MKNIQKDRLPLTKKHGRYVQRILAVGAITDERQTKQTTAVDTYREAFQKDVAKRIFQISGQETTAEDRNYGRLAFHKRPIKSFAKNNIQPRDGSDMQTMDVSLSE